MPLFCSIGVSFYYATFVLLSMCSNTYPQDAFQLWLPSPYSLASSGLFVNCSTKGCSPPSSFTGSQTCLDQIR